MLKLLKLASVIPFNMVPLFFYFIFFYVFKVFFFNFILFLNLKHCISFAKHQNESATGIHVLPMLNPPPSSLPTPSLWVVPVHQPQASSIVSSVHGIFPGKNIGEGCHFLLQGIFSLQGSNLCLLHLLHWQVDSLPLSHLGSPQWNVTQP